LCLTHDNVYLLQSWYHVSDPKVRITTTMSIYHRVDTTCQTQKYVLQQQCILLLGLTRGIISVINRDCCCNTYFWVWHVVSTLWSIDIVVVILQQQCLFITKLIPRVRPKSTYYNHNVYLSQSWYHVSDTKVRITTTMSRTFVSDMWCQLCDQYTLIVVVIRTFGTDTWYQLCDK
jgi:hypothetical protein